MVEQMSKLESEISASDVCFKCIEHLVKEPGGIEDVAQKINRCSINGHYNYDVDFLVSSVDKRVANIVFEVDWLQEESPAQRYYEVIRDRVHELKPMLRKMLSQLGE